MFLPVFISLGLFLSVSVIDAGKTCGRQYNMVRRRVIGGTNVESIDEFPWSVSIQVRDSGAWWQECGGAFLTDGLVLTAAHCANNGYIPYRAVFGCSNINSDNCQVVYFGYEDFVVHEDYKDDGIRREIGDIAIIRLPDKANYTSQPGRAVGSVCLPKKIRDYEGREVTAIGWGLTRSGEGREDYSDVLQKYTATVIDVQSCRRTEFDLPPNIHICTSRGDYNEGACNGDSGGPLMRKARSGQMVVIGVAIDTAPDCVSGPILYTRVDYYLDWIIDVFRSSY